MRMARRRAVSGRKIPVGGRPVWASLRAWVPAQPVSVSLPASVWAREVSVLRPALASAETASTERSIAVARSTVPVVVRRELQHLHPTLAEEADPRENGMNAEAVDELYIVSLAAVGACLQLLPGNAGLAGSNDSKI